MVSMKQLNLAALIWLVLASQGLALGIDEATNDDFELAERENWGLEARGGSLECWGLETRTNTPPSTPKGQAPKPKGGSIAPSEKVNSPGREVDRYFQAEHLRKHRPPLRMKSARKYRSLKARTNTPPSSPKSNPSTPKNQKPAKKDNGIAPHKDRGNAVKDLLRPIQASQMGRRIHMNKRGDRNLRARGNTPPPSPKSPKPSTPRGQAPKKKGGNISPQMQKTGSAQDPMRMFQANDMGRRRGAL